MRRASVNDQKWALEMENPAHCSTGHKPGLSSWECNQYAEQARPAHRTAHSTMQTTDTSTEGYLLMLVESRRDDSHINSHHHKLPYLKSSSQPQRTLLWHLKTRSSEIHQTYHHTVVLLLSHLLQNTAKELKVIQILFYDMDKIFPAGKA